MTEKLKEIYKNNKKIKKLTISLMLVALCLFVLWSVLLGFVVSNSSYFAPKNADAIVVLGHAIDDKGNPSPWLTARLKTAVELYAKGYAPYIILTGGVGPNSSVAVSYVMANHVLEAGVPPTSVLTEISSNNTYQNFNMVHSIAESLDMQSIIVVTNGFHMYRSLLLGGLYFDNIYPAPSPIPFGVEVMLAYMREPLSVIANFLLYIIT
ncbi:MAG: YdcF family protein [Defluviitaleaceae bacterium]|nr:YdcF family protein [Defluviitaleaceae bacterium]